LGTKKATLSLQDSDLESPPKKSKLGNKKVEIGDQKFRSKREANRWLDLMALVKSGRVENLRREVPFVLAPAIKINGRTKPALRYYADFVYLLDGAEIVEDCKGWRTDVYRIKRHLMATVHGITILES
jgi:hypothetical protein